MVIYRKGYCLDSWFSGGVRKDEDVIGLGSCRFEGCSGGGGAPPEGTTDLPFVLSCYTTVQYPGSEVYLPDSPDIFWAQG